MAVKKKGLGKGLDSLIPDNKSISPYSPQKCRLLKKRRR